MPRTKGQEARGRLRGCSKNTTTWLWKGEKMTNKLKKFGKKPTKWKGRYADASFCL
jgi:hypothetical protein